MKTSLKAVLCLVLLAAVASGQSTTGLSADRYVVAYKYDGSDNLEYTCWFRGTPPTSTFSVTTGTLTSIVDSSSTATGTAPNHGLTPGNVITVSGASDADLNVAAIVLTTPTVNTFTFATSGVTDATYNGASLAYSTTAPLTSDDVWVAIRRYVYDSSGNLIKVQWATGAVSNGSLSPKFAYFVCDSASSYAYDTR